jgi:plasmid stabilization system protein ParE
MALLKIFWTATAIKQRNYIFEYWNERNKSISYSQKLNLKIKERTELLKSNPNLGIKTEFNGTRTISLGHFSIFYKKNDSSIFITAFWDNRQDPKRLIQFLKSSK